MLNDLLGNREVAKKYYNETLRLKERNNSHELARRYLKEPYKKY